MGQHTHIIDPNGDVIIILRNPNPPFAEPGKSFVVHGALATLSEPNNNSIQNLSGEVKHFEAYTYTGKRGHKKKGKKRKTCNSLTVSAEPVILRNETPAEQPEGPVPEAELVVEESPIAGEVHVAEEPTASENLAVMKELASFEGIEKSLETMVAGRQDEPCFRVRVSGKHLIFASSVFKNILTGCWRESVTYQQNGYSEIDAEDWDIEAFLLVLRVIHGQNFGIPRKLTLEKLAKVAVIVDYYKCNEAMDILKEIWITALGEKVPTTYSRDLILWLWVSWVFKLPDEFKQSTSVAMSQSDGWISNWGLPIPSEVICSMNSDRQKAIDELILHLHGTHEALLNGIRGCNFECRSIMYGALTLQMKSSNLFSPKPAAPFLDLRYKELVQKVMSFTSPQWHINYYGNSHSCSDSSFRSLLGKFKDCIEGLNLDTYT